MPPTSEVLGWDSKWFEEALLTAEIHLVKGIPIKVLAAPYYLATKIEAFEGRGKRDFLCSQDLEDIICLMNGRKEIVEEVKDSSHALCHFLAKNFREWVLHEDFQNSVEGFLVTENEPSGRREMLLQRFHRIADMA